MPLPSPTKNEKREDFISRCMNIIKDENKPQDQKIAICYSQWKTKSKNSFDFSLNIKESKTITRNSKKNGKSEKRIIVGYVTTYDVFTNGDTLQITREALEGAKDDLLKYSTVLFNHDQNRPIGTIIETATDDKGLLMKMVLSNSEKDIWEKVQDGTICKISFWGEFSHNDYEMIESEDKIIMQVKKIQLFEASLVSVPGNVGAQTITSYVENTIKEYRDNKSKIMLEEQPLEQQTNKSFISKLESLKESVISEEAKITIDDLVNELHRSKEILANLQILSGKLSEEDRKVVESAIFVLKSMLKPNEEPCENAVTAVEYDLADESDVRPIFQLTSDESVELSDDPKKFKKQILKYGKWYHWGADNGVLNITESVIDNIVKNFNKKTLENVYVPLTHTDDPSKNTGEVIKLEKTSTGLDAVIEIRDDSIAEKIKNKLIKFVSASLDPNYKNKKTNEFVGATLRHVALVTEPYLKGMGQFVALSDGETRPIIQLDNEEPNPYNILKSINERLEKLENKLEKNMEIKETKPEVEVKETKTNEVKVEETKTEEKIETKEEKTIETKIEPKEISIEEAKSTYKTCVADAMKEGMAMPDAIKKCKSDIKENFIINFSEDTSEESSEEDESEKESEKKNKESEKQDVDLADAEKEYDGYLKVGKIVPAQKDAFIKLFTSGKKIELSDEKVGMSEFIKTFMEKQPKIVDFSEEGTSTGTPVVTEAIKEEMPAEVKDFYVGKMQMSDEDAKEAWEFAKNQAKADKEESTIFN
jgi:HK97 family phage prohead protease